MKSTTQIKSITIGEDEIRAGVCSCREVRIYDKTFDIWTEKNLFGDDHFFLTELKIIELVNQATSLKIVKEDKTERLLLIIETETHKIVVVGREVA